MDDLTESTEELIERSRTFRESVTEYLKHSPWSAEMSASFNKDIQEITEFINKRKQTDL